MISDGSAGAIVAWDDARSGNADIYAQRLAAADGSSLWPAAGAAISLAAADQDRPALAPDGNGGAYIAWQDTRDAIVSAIDIYAQRVSSTGQVGSTVDVSDDFLDGLRLLPPQPNPAHGQVNIHYSLSFPSRVSLKLYDAAGRLVRTLEDGSALPGRHEVWWDGRDNHGTEVGGGIYFLRLRAGNQQEDRRMVFLTR